MSSRTLPVFLLLVSFVFCGLLLLPARASGEPFGGQIQRIVFCQNAAIYVNLSAPRGGEYIWTAGTRTYPFGPPSHTGQWLLGLGSAPYFCVESIFPLRILTGTFMDMVGSSQ